MNILLISMPFASAQFASMGLSSLRPVLEQEGMTCDILYQNLAFRNFVNDPKSYDDLTDQYLIGEWIFGRALFGDTWADSQRGSLENITSAIKAKTGMSPPKKLINVILNYRQAASAFIDQCMAEVEWDKYEVIGFTSVFDQQIASLALAQRIKNNYPSKVIVFGGANCQGRMGQAIMEHFSFVDWVISGDGEQSFLQAIKCFFNGETLEGIRGLTYRKNNSIVDQGSDKVMDLNKLPYPDFTNYFDAIDKWAPDLKGQVPLPIELSRGCWSSAKSQCIFCGIHSQLNAYRHKRPERALSEINNLVSLYGINNVWVIDSNLPLNYYNTVLPALSTKDKKLSDFFVETKANIKYDKLQKLKYAGSNAFQPGIESLDTEILQYMCKGTTMLQNVRILKWARECGLSSVWNFIHSFPGEDTEAYQRMTVLVPYLVHLQPPINVGPVILQRFSPLFNNPEQWNLSNIRASEFYEFIYPFDIEILNQLAYTFDYDVEEGVSPQNYLKDVVDEMMLWKELWKKDEPPLLVYEWDQQGNMVVYDTRPIRQSYYTNLKKTLALALLACNAGATFAEIVCSVKKDIGEMNYPGDCYLQEGMKQLETYGFVIREKEYFLGLVYSLKTFRQNNKSFLAYLLER